MQVGSGVAGLPSGSAQVASVWIPFEAVQMTVLAPFGNANGEVMVVLPILQVIVGVGKPTAVTVKARVAVQTFGSVVVLMSDWQAVNDGG